MRLLLLLPDKTPSNGNSIKERLKNLFGAAGKKKYIR
jgi:hypothetical protein